METDSITQAEEAIHEAQEYLVEALSALDAEAVSEARDQITAAQGALDRALAALG